MRSPGTAMKSSPRSSQLEKIHMQQWRSRATNNQFLNKKRVNLIFKKSWIKLEPIIQSEVSQKDKHQYSILMHIYGILKDGNDNPICKTEKRDRYIEQTFGLYGRRRGWDDLREQHWKMYIIKCETDRQSRMDAWDKCSGLVHWEDPEGWDGEGDGRGDQDGEHM